MSRRVRTLASSVAIAAAAMVGAPLASASPAPPTAQSVAAPELSFTIPAVGGLEIGPGGVPGGSFQQTTVTARSTGPGVVSFSAANPAAWSEQYSYRYLSVAWRNLQTGQAGAVDLRHWQHTTPPITGYPASLPTSATAATGSGPVVAIVTVLREQWERPAMPISVIPGVSALVVQ